jgi:hypothetical protein
MITISSAILSKVLTVILTVAYLLLCIGSFSNIWLVKDEYAVGLFRSCASKQCASTSMDYTLEILALIFFGFISSLVALVLQMVNEFQTMKNAKILLIAVFVSLLCTISTSIGCLVLFDQDIKSLSSLYTYGWSQRVFISSTCLYVIAFCINVATFYMHQKHKESIDDFQF